MTWLDLVWFPPLMLAVSAVVGGAGRAAGEVAGQVRRTFVAFTAGVIVVALVVRAVVLLFA